MTDTNMTDEWIARVVRENPCKVLDDGNFRTCPVRLSFPNVFKRSKPIAPNPEGKFGANLVFPLGADLSVLKKAAGDVAMAKWPKAGTSEGPKLKNPFKDAGEMTKYEGYVTGGVYITANADTQPKCVNQQLAPITDESKVYPGVWACALIRPFSYDKGVNKGVSFGLQQIMVIADDKQWGGGQGDTQKAFAGVNIDAAVNPAAQFEDGEEAAKRALFG